MAHPIPSSCCSAPNNLLLIAALLLAGLAVPLAFTCTGFRSHGKCWRQAGGAGAGVDIHGRVLAVADHQNPHGRSRHTVAIEASDRAGRHRPHEVERHGLSAAFTIVNRRKAGRPVHPNPLSIDEHSLSPLSTFTANSPHTRYQTRSSSSLHRFVLRALQAASSTSSSIFPSPVSRSTTYRRLASAGFVGCGICGTSYRAGVGDTFNSVAAYCNVQPQDLKAANPSILGPSLTNTTLKVPCSGQDPANCGICGSSYIIQAQDTLSNASLNCHIDLSLIEAANPGIDYDSVFGGQFITIPCGEQNVSTLLVGCGACGTVYKAPANEKVQDVVRACGSSYQALQNSNPAIRNSTNILAGQQLNIPCTGNYSQHCGLCGTNYTMMDQDSWQSVSAKCRVGMISLQLENPGIARGSFLAGEVVHIPCPEVVSPVCSSGCNGSTQVLGNETTLADVAQRCNVSSDLLSYANSIPKYQPQVKPGQTLFVPCAQVGEQQSNCSICGSSITLQAYVPLSQVAEACHINTTEITSINPPNVDLTLLGPGDRVALPCSGGACGGCGIAYAAKAGDTLQSVAVECATMATQIVQSNPGLNWSTAFANGAVLTMPCGFPAAAVASAATASEPRLLGWWWLLLYVFFL